MTPIFHHGRDRTEPEGYDVAQICLNGHCVNSSYLDYPQFNEDHCSKCGQPTITACKKCNTEIRGHYRGVFSVRYEAPAFCHKCGSPYPWTDGKVNAASELAMELDNLSDEEKKQLSQSLDDLVREGPKTSLAATRFKKLMAKAGAVAADSFKKILVDVVSETAKKMIWPESK